MDRAEGLLTYEDSALLREALQEYRLDVSEYFNDGAYPRTERRRMKSKIE